MNEERALVARAIGSRVLLDERHRAERGLQLAPHTGKDGFGHGDADTASVVEHGLDGHQPKPRVAGRREERSRAGESFLGQRLLAGAVAPGQDAMRRGRRPAGNEDGDRDRFRCRAGRQRLEPREQIGQAGARADRFVDELRLGCRAARERGDVGRSNANRRTDVALDAAEHRVLGRPVADGRPEHAQCRQNQRGDQRAADEARGSRKCHRTITAATIRVGRMDPLPMDSLLLRAALKRGLLIVVANWPIVLIDFAVDVFCQLAIAVPVVGGALMVATVAGIDLELLLSEGVVATADVVVGSLTSRPAALASFLFAVAVVAVAAEVVRFVVKAGTLSVVVTADAVAGEIQRLPLTMHVVRRARAFGLERLVTASRRFVGRAVQLSLWLALAYAVVAICYIALVTWHPPARGSVWLPAWSMLVLAATSTAIVAAAAARFSVTLMRIVIVTDDCSISTAARRLARFVIEDARQVVGVVAAVAGLQVVALGVG